MPQKAKAGACDAGLEDISTYQGSFSHSEPSAGPQGLDALAERFVRYLLGAGAIDLQTDGTRWFHNVLPGCRDACRRVKAQHDVTSPGMSAAIVRAIGRLQREAA